MRPRTTLELEGHLTGIAIPVSALRSRDGCGIGEFLDLPVFASWARTAGFDLVQILPVNDTGSNPSPYSAVSAFALHPIYIRLQRLPGWETMVDNIRAFQEATLSRDRVQFEVVLDFKLDVLQRLFRLDAESNGVPHDWLDANPWVRAYSVYKCLKARNNHRNWNEWTVGRDLDESQIDDLWDETGSDARFHAWVQYHLDRQLTEAAERFESEGIYLKGDVPILMNVDSADVWAHRSYFDLDFRAGAPPDMFATLGQMWGFPIYDWQALERDDYRWWRSRLKHASRYYHAFRIDHVLGFFRIWSVPATENSAVLGVYRPANYLTAAEIDDCARPDGYVHRLTRAWTTTDAAAAVLGEHAPRILEQYFDDAGNGDHLLRPDTDSESSIDRIVDEAAVKTFLTERHRDRTFLEAHEGSFAPAWFATTSSGYLKGGDESRQRIDEMVELYKERSKPIWLEMGRRLLEVVKESSTMLPCAEDLGVVPPGLPAVLADLGILSLKIERWETDEDGRLKDPATFPYLSVSTPGVHDTSALRGWWEEDDWNRDSFSLDLAIDEVPSWLTPEVAKLILLRSLRSNSAIRVFQIQDLFAVTLDLRTLSPHGERVNVPGSVGGANWSYSVPILIERLADHNVTGVLRNLIARSVSPPNDSTPSVEKPDR